MESPEEQERRKIATVVELGLICETVSAIQVLTSSEKPSLLAGLLALILLLIVRGNSHKQ